MAPPTIAWTLADLDRLPDDGNTYELIDGELFVTPAPSPAHEELVSRLLKVIAPFVWKHGIGAIYTPHAVVRKGESQVEPDLMVRRAVSPAPETWVETPTPLLVVEVLSRTTQRRDREQKRNFYLRIGGAEYWMVDRWERCIHVVQRDAADVVADSQLEWQPHGVTEPLRIDVVAYFDAVLGTR